MAGYILDRVNGEEAIMELILETLLYHGQIPFSTVNRFETAYYDRV